MNYYSTDYIGATGLHPIFEYVDDASNVISNRVNNFSNIIGLSDVNYTTNWHDLSTIYGNNLIEISSNIGFIDISDKSNRCIIRYGDIKAQLEGLSDNEKLAKILGVNYLGIPNIDTLISQLLEIYSWGNNIFDDDFEFVIINNTYPFPYTWLKDISSSILLNNDNINIYDRRINSSNITNNVEELIKIVAEHEIRLSTSEFRSTLNPIDTAKLVAKWSYKAAQILMNIKPLTAGVLAQLAVHLGVSGINPVFAYTQLRDYDDAVTDAIMNSVDTIIAQQYVVNGGFGTAIGELETEMKAVWFAVFGTALGSGVGTLFNFIGDWVSEAINLFSTDEDGKLTEIKSLNECLWYVFHREPLNNTILESATVNQDLNGKICHPLNNVITREAGNKYPFRYNYGVMGENYIDLLIGNNVKRKEYLLLFETAFSLSLKITFKNINNIVQFFNIGYYLQLHYGNANLYFKILLPDQTTLVQQSVSYNFVENQEYHIVFAHGKTSGLKIYINKVEVLSGNYNLETTPTLWNTVTNINSFYVLPFASECIVEDFRIIPTKISVEDVAVLYDTYRKVPTIEDILRSEIVYSSNEIIYNINNTSNFIRNTSNELAITDRNTSNWIYNNSNELAITDRNTSNWIRNNSNELAITDRNTSNWIRNNSNELAINIFNTSNWIRNNSNELAITDRNTSNWIRNNSNELAITDRNTSNWIKIFRDDINLKTDGLWRKGNNIVYNFDDNIGIGTLSSSYKLNVSGSLFSKTIEIGTNLDNAKLVITSNANLVSWFVPYGNGLWDMIKANFKYVENYYYRDNKMAVYRVINDTNKFYGMFDIFNGGVTNKFSISFNIFIRDATTFDTQDENIQLLELRYLNGFVYQVQIIKVNSTRVVRIVIGSGGNYRDFNISGLVFDFINGNTFSLTFDDNAKTIRLYTDGVLHNTVATFEAQWPIYVTKVQFSYSYNTYLYPTMFDVENILFHYDVLTNNQVYDLHQVLNAMRQVIAKVNGTLKVYNLEFDNLTYAKNGQIFSPNLITNFEKEQTNEQITVQDARRDLNDPVVSTRRQLSVGSSVINSTSNLLNETGNSGYLYYESGYNSSIAQVKSISYSELANKPASFPPSQHTHAISEITDLQTTLDGKVSSQWTTSGTTIYYNVSGARVGIGTATPASLFEVNGWVVSKNSITNSFSGVILKNNNDTKWCQLQFGNTANTTLGSANFGIYMNNTYRLIILDNGNVGIGKTNPTTPLDVSGDINYSGTLRKNGTDVLQYLETSNLNTSNYILTLQTQLGTKQNTLTASTDISINGLLVNNGIRLLKNFSQHPDGTFALDKPNIVGGKLNILTDGKVGINKPAPEHLLDVGGDINYTGTLRKSGIDVLQYLETSNLNTSNYVLNTYNDISNIISGLNNVSLETIGNIVNTSNLNTSNYVLNVSNTKQNTLTASTDISINGLLVNNGIRLLKNFSQHPDGTFALDKPNIVGGKLNILTDGKVGINKPAPAHLLDVGGDINYSGNLLKNSTNVLQYLDATSSIQTQLNAKQNTLTAGTNITIANNLISSTGTSQWITSQSEQNLNTYIAYNGIVNINGGANYACFYNRMTAGSLTIGNTLTNYGLGTTGWSTNSAGLLMECADNTEIAVHDNATRLISLMSYEGSTTNRIQIGRKMETGGTTIGTTTIWGNVGIGVLSPSYKLEVNGTFRLLNGFSQHPDGVFALDKPNIVGGRVMCLANGNFGINKPAPEYALDVGGDINISGSLLRNGVPIYMTYEGNSYTMAAYETSYLANATLFNQFTTTGFFSYSIICTTNSDIYACGHIYLNTNKNVKEHTSTFQTSLQVTYNGFIYGLSLYNNNSTALTFRLVFKDLTV